jgi:hypothetical protein
MGIGSLTNYNNIELRIEPSKLLYNIDRPAYIELLRSSKIEQTQISKANRIKSKEENNEIPFRQDTSVNIHLEREYKGILLPYKAELIKYLHNLGLSDSLLETREINIVDSFYLQQKKIWA